LWLAFQQAAHVRAWRNVLVRVSSNLTRWLNQKNPPAESHSHSHKNQFWRQILARALELHPEAAPSCLSGWTAFIVFLSTEGGRESSL
jgi:hypothetical protein